MSSAHHFSNIKNRPPVAEKPDADALIDAANAEENDFAAVAESVPAGAAITLTADDLVKILGQTRGGSGFTPQDLELILAKFAQVNAAATQTALNRENPNYVTVSPFHQDGKEAIPKYLVFFGPSQTTGKGGQLPNNMYTPEERDLINRFSPNELKTARAGAWSAQVVINGSTQELIIKVPMGSMDQRQTLPAFSLILRELLDGEVAVNPLALHEELVKSNTRIAELERKLAANAA